MKETGLDKCYMTYSAGEWSTSFIFILGYLHTCCGSAQELSPLKEVIRKAAVSLLVIFVPQSPEYEYHDTSKPELDRRVSCIYVSWEAVAS